MASPFRILGRPNSISDGRHGRARIQFFTPESGDVFAAYCRYVHFLWIWWRLLRPFAQFETTEGFGGIFKPWLGSERKVFANSSSITGGCSVLLFP